MTTMPDVDPWQPPVPPPFPDDGREVVTRFEGWVAGHTSTVKGYDKFTIAVPKQDIFKAMLMMQQPMMLYFEVSAQAGGEMGDMDEELARILGIDVSDLQDDADSTSWDDVDWNDL